MDSQERGLKATCSGRVLMRDADMGLRGLHSRIMEHGILS